MIGRRTFIAGLGSAAAWPVVARAQQSAMPVIGFLALGTLEAYGNLVSAFRRGLAEGGYIEDRNVVIEYRWLEGHYDRIPMLVAELVRRHVDLIVTSPNSQVAVAAKAATQTIPIVFRTGGDPVATGLVASLSRPAGNATGVTGLSAETNPKRINLLHELVPNAGVIAVLLNPANIVGLQGGRLLNEIQAPILGHRMLALEARSENELDKALGTLAPQGVAALLVTPDPLFASLSVQIVTWAARLAIPTMYFRPAFVDLGGLISYSANESALHRKVGAYAARILKGEKPADLPVEQPTEFELVINLKTAKTLGLTIPPGILAIADRVVE
jgi:putative ABC transport system substrate-binding protein